MTVLKSRLCWNRVSSQRRQSTFLWANRIVLPVCSNPFQEQYYQQFGGSPSLRQRLGVLSRFLHGFDLATLQPDYTLVQRAPGVVGHLVQRRRRPVAERGKPVFSGPANRIGKPDFGGDVALHILRE